MFVITGASGHTGGLIAKTLLEAGRPVRVVGRSADRLRSFEDQGAEIAVADLLDKGALTAAFKGGQAVFAMVPPNMASNDYRAEQDVVANAIVSAIKESRVGNVVTLSSIGADKAAGTGPVAGLHYLEERLNSIEELNTLHLRAAYFMENTLEFSGIIRSYGVVADALQKDLKIPMIATRDIAGAAADALLQLSFKGHQAKELQGQRDLNMGEVTSIIGRAIGKPDLQYTQMPDEAYRSALIQAGLNSDIAAVIAELAEALNSGLIKSLEPRTTSNTTPTSYETFVAEVFVPHFQQA